MSEWVFFNKLARSSRPGYPNEDLAPAVVDMWIRNLRRDLVVIPSAKYRITERPTVPRSLVTFLSFAELHDFYAFDLLDYYRQHGFDVYHIPTEDPVYKQAGDHGPTFTFAQLNKLNQIYENCKQPLIMHCSAGMDRTGAAVQYLKMLHPNDITDIDKKIEQDRLERQAKQWADWDRRQKQQNQQKTPYVDPDLNKDYNDKDSNIWGV